MHDSRVRVLVARAFILALALTACGDATPAPDSGSVDGGDATIFPDGGTGGMTPPQIPWLDAGVPPVATPSWDVCPVGWRRVEEEDAAYCEPFPLAGPATCAEGEAHFLGAVGCEPIGSPCPSGDFADGLPAGTIYVDPTAPAGGDGSAGAPHSSLADVPWSTLSSGDTVALSKGTFSGYVSPAPGTTVVGACARETIVTGPATGPTLGMSRVGTATVRDITISEPPEGAVWVRGGQELTLEGVIIERVPGQALLAQDGGVAILSRVVIRDGQTPVAGSFPRGIVAALGARVTLAHVVFERVVGVAMHAQGAGTQITAEDVVARDTLTEPGTGLFGAAVLSTDGSTVEIRRALLERCVTAAALASQPGSEISLETVIVRDMVLPTRGSVISNGLVADMGGRVVADDLLVERHFEYAAVASKEGSELELTDAILRGGRTSRSDRSGRGFGAQLGAGLTVARALVADYDGVGVYVADELTTASIEDVIVRDPADSPEGGSGILVAYGAEATLARARVERARGVGIHPVMAGSRLDLEDVAVRGTRPLLETDLYGEGMSVQNEGQLIGRRILIEGSRRLGMSAFHLGTEVTLEDVVIRDTRPEIATARAGQGLHVGFEAHATLSRIRIEESHEVGLAAVNGTVDATDVTVAGVSRDGCVEGGCAPADGESAIGALASFDGSLTLTRFAVERSEVCGIMVASAGQMDLSDGVITQSAIGACVQIDGYPLDRITDGVAYLDNGSNLDSTMLPVPGELEPVIR